MARYERFTFLVSHDERELIASLARSLQRSQSDAVRWLVINAAKELASQADNQVQLADKDFQRVLDAHPR